ncbi:MAG TPA: tyrosine-type recombinase/integrase [Streptosporangiaceae bacterium]
MAQRTSRRAPRTGLPRPRRAAPEPRHRAQARRPARAVAAGCPSLAAKKIGVHTLRHTCAMTLLRSGVDLATIALWLGHEDLRTVQIYLHADLELKERALARTTPPHTTPGRYRPPDPVLAFLESL